MFQEVPQRLLKLSPHELVYERTVCEPLQVLHQLWEGEEAQTTYEYIFQLEKRLKLMCDLARQELVKAQEVQKVLFQ